MSKKKRKYGNPMKEKAYRESLKKDRGNDLYDFMLAYLKRTEKNETKFLVGQDKSQFDDGQLMVDLSVAVSSNGQKLSNITSHSSPYEITAAVPNKKGSFNLVSAIFNESEIVMWMPNVEKSMVSDAAEYLKMNRVKLVAEKYKKFYPEFAA